MAQPTPTQPSTRKISALRPTRSRNSKSKPEATQPKWAAPAVGRSTLSLAVEPTNITVRFTNFCATDSWMPRRSTTCNNHMVQNNFGASFGGPIVHNRTFFFVNYEGFRHAMADTMIDTVPTLDEISGDFSHAGVNGNAVHI